MSIGMENSIPWIFRHTCQSRWKRRITVRQISKPGGTLLCEFCGERVKIGGTARCYLKGELQL